MFCFDPNGLWGATLTWMQIPSIKEKILNILTHGHVPQLPQDKQGCELFRAAGDGELLPPFVLGINRLLASPRAAGCFLCSWLSRENVKMSTLVDLPGAPCVSTQ